MQQTSNLLAAETKVHGGHISALERRSRESEEGCVRMKDSRVLEERLEHTWELLVWVCKSNEGIAHLLVFYFLKGSLAESLSYRG